MTGAQTAPLNPTGVPGASQETERDLFQPRGETAEEVGVDEDAEARFDNN